MLFRSPDITVVDMDHDDSTALLGRLGASNSLTRSVTPVLGLTRRGDLKTKLLAFDLGVYDILTMPFSPEELLALSIVITRLATVTDRPIIPTIRIGEIEIYILNRQVRAGQSVVHLSGIEQSLLYLLASRGGRVVTREEILDAIWGTDFMAESNVVWGVLFKDPSLPGGLLALAATLALIATAKADEAECTRFFGPAYLDYMQRTRMFVPFLF